MSNLNVTNINGSDAEAGKAKAYLNMNGTGTIAVNGSFNVSSIVDVGTGQYSANFTASFSANTYTIQVSKRANLNDSNIALMGALAIGQSTFMSADGSTVADAIEVYLTAHGDLA